MPTTETVVIGAGQAGLALSRWLTAAGHDHVVVDRGRIGERWRSERWDSLRLLTPAWMTRLPFADHPVPDPDAFWSAADVVGLLEGYAASFDAPVRVGVTVESVRPARSGWLVATDAGTWRCSSVVIATGTADVPAVPPASAGVPHDVAQLTPSAYRNPGALPAGGVLVVGAAASGLQIADEVARAGRRVVLSVGEHVRLLRRYRGRDIFGWLEAIGSLDRRIEDVADPRAARRSPSLQLVGRPDHADLDLAVARRHGVELAGRLTAVEAGLVELADDLADTTARAERRLHRLLDGIDAVADPHGRLPEPRRPAAVPVPATPRRLDLRAEGIGTVVWATGYRRAHPWLHVPGLDASCGVAHTAGVVHGVEGLYVLGMPFQTRRRSTFIDGVGEDARLVAAHLLRHHRCRRRHRTQPLVAGTARTA